VETRVSTETQPWHFPVKNILEAILHGPVIIIQPEQRSGKTKEPMDNQMMPDK
jgi:hypothetical protein